MIVTLVMALTVDGKIGVDPNHFPDWTGKADKKLFADVSRRAGVVIMGSKTYDTIGSPLSGRKNIVLTRNKDRRSKWPNLVFTDQSPQEILKHLTREGYKAAVLAGGSSINTLFARAGLIDQIILTISPKVFGKGLSLFSETVAMDLLLESVDRIDADRVCLRYKVIKS